MNAAQFLTELRRRKVFRGAVGYAVGALAVVEATDLVLPRLGISDSAVTVILVVALLGFPVGDSRLALRVDPGRPGPHVPARE